MARIEVIIVADDPGDEDAKHDTGLTTHAYDRLVDALSRAGFSYESIERQHA